MSPKNDGLQRLFYVFTWFFIVVDCLNVSAKKCLKNGLYDHPADCAKFYLCASFGPVTMHCPAGLHFNPNLLVCDWPQNAGCRSRKSDGNISDCPIYPHPHDCTKFYTCTSSGRLLMDCPEGLHFNSQLLVCDWPRNVECFNESSPEAYLAELTTMMMNDGGTGEKYSTTTTRQDVDNEASTPKESLLPSTTTDADPPPISDDVCTTIWSHPRDCRKFLMASPMGNIEISCPSDLLFNPALLVCDSASNVECLEGTISTTLYFDSSTDTSTHIDEEIPLPSTAATITNVDYPQICKGSLWPHPTDCAKFFMCTSTGPVEVACPGELLFNPTWLVCDWPMNFECNQVNSFENTAMTTAATTSLTSGADEEITTPNFEEFGSTSTLPTTTDLDVSTTEPGETTNNEGAPLESTSPQLCEVGDLWPHPTDCAKFLKCDSSGALEDQCPEGLFFNPALLVCDWPKNVECVSYDLFVSTASDDASTTIVENGTEQVNNNEVTYEPALDLHDTSSIRYSETTTSEIRESEMNMRNNAYTEICKGSLWPHPTDCAKFFKCDSSGPREDQCPEDLLFNPALLVCDWPKHVHCRRS